ncbi:MAG: glutamyl-tRNA reductase [Spirochaetes bacterium]|nr:MAG: glutamyl-tRNA reductase [Spirochaetota bacterium]
MSARTDSPDLVMLGISHKTAPVELREKFALGEGELPAFFERACSQGADEIVYLSTCNRMEIYVASRDVNAALEGLFAHMEAVSALPRAVIEAQTYRKYSRDAVVHLFTVASSLDSMVVGENEIFFQVKNCYSRSVHAKKTGPLLNRLFHQAFKTAKRVKTETEISKNPLSIAYIATELAGKIFDNLSRHNALLIGAGEMGELILKYLTKAQIGGITIANRSLHNAERIAQEINREARIVPLDEIGAVAPEVDIIIASVTAPGYVIDAAAARAIQKRRGGRPIFVIDIAVPRNVDPEAGKLDAVFLYNVDDLRSIADENLKSRLREVEFAKRLVEADADEFIRWYDGLALVPAIQKLQSAFDEIRVAELERYRRRRLKHLADEDFRIIEDLTRQIMTKTLHNPISTLKKHLDASRENGDAHDVRDTKRIIEELFEK